MGGGWANPLQTLPQGLVLTFDFDFDPDPDPELDNSKASKPKLLLYLQVGLPIFGQLLAVLRDSVFTDGENFNSILHIL